MSQNNFTYSLLMVLSKVNDDPLQLICAEFDTKTHGMKFGDIGFGNGVHIMIDCGCPMSFDDMLEIEPRFIEFVDDESKLDLSQDEAEAITEKWKFT